MPSRLYKCCNLRLYTNVAQQLFDDVNNSFQNDNITTDQQELLNKLNQNLITLRQISSIEQLTNNQIAGYYFTNGFSKTRVYVENYYKELLDSEDELVKSYGENLSARDLNVTLQLYIYQANGCIINNTLDSACTEPLAESSDIQFISAQTATTNSRLDAQLNNYIVAIIDAMGQLSQNINGVEYDMQEEYIDVA